MFGFRSDGKKLKKVDPIIRFTTYIMPKRYDAQVEMVKEIRCEEMDKYIREKNEQGIKLSYMHIVIAGLVRMYALRPKLNRFVMSGRVYRRNKIYISFTIKQKLIDDADEATIKIAFTGHESLMQIKDMIDTEIAKNVKSLDKNSTVKTANGFLKLPHFILKPTLGFVKWLDKCGMMPKKIIEASPFHTSCFLTNMKSIGTNFVYHHIYDFGTTGLFVSMGKEKYEPCIDAFGKYEIGKVMKLGLVIDERLCDGLYYAKAIKIGTKHIQNPRLLEEGLKEVYTDPNA